MTQANSRFRAAIVQAGSILFDSPLGKLRFLICWENDVPLLCAISTV
jgi:hypothetical protein